MTLPDRRDVPGGTSQRTLHDDPACGDGWSPLCDAQGWRVLVVDGLGHGAEAAATGTAACAERAARSSDQQLGLLHQAMRSTRGGAAAMAQYDYRTHTLRFAGLGNIIASLHGAARPPGLASRPGSSATCSARSRCRVIRASATGR